jgi:3-oxoacyl-[acyl-carrier-protein] synthase III
MTSWMLAETARDDVPYRARFESVGVKLPEQRVSSSTETAVSLALAAARDCLTRSRYGGTDLDVVISASITREGDGTVHRFEPPLSTTIKQHIGAARATSFDLSNAGAGMLTAVFLLDDMIRRGAIRRGMVVSGEHVPGIVAPPRGLRGRLGLRRSVPQLEDSGAAVIVERATDGQEGIVLAAFTTYAEHGPSELCVQEMLEVGGLGVADVDRWLPQRVENGEKAASTTPFIALYRSLNDHELRTGERVVLASAGGLELGVVVFVVDELEIRHGDTH